MKMSTCFFLLCLTIGVIAEDYSWSYFNNMDQITSFCEYNGSVYIGTTGGLAAVSKTDLSVKHYLKSSIALKSNYVLASGTDSSGNLYVITCGNAEKNAMSKFNGKSWVIAADTLGSSELIPVTTSNGVFSLQPKPAVADQNGNIWSFTKSGPTVFDGTVTKTVTDGLAFNKWNYKLLTTDYSGRVFYLHDTTIYLYNGTRWVDSIDLSLNDASPQAFAAGKNSLFLGTTKGLCEISSSGIIWHTKATGVLSSDTVTLLFVDKSNNLWGGTSKTGFRYNGKSWSNLDLNYCNIPRGGIDKLHCDSSGNIWFIADNKIVMYNGSDFICWDNDRLGFTLNYTVSLAVTPEAVYAAQKQKIIKFDGTLWSKYKDSVSIGGVNDVIWFMTGDRSGNIWCAMTAGIFKIDSNRNTSILKPSGFVSGMSDMIMNFYVDVYDTLWFVNNGGRFGKISGNTIQERIISADIDYITTFAVDSDGTIWMTPENHGFIADWGSGYSEFTPNDFGISAFCVFCMCIDHDGKKWFGTYWMGLIYDAEKDYTAGQCTLFNPDNSGYAFDKTNYNSSIIEDKQGNIWIGGSFGITVLNRGEGTVTGIRKKHENANRISVYSYNCGSKLRITVNPQHHNETKLRIVDLLGRTALKQQISKMTTVTVNRSELRSGVYCAQINSRKANQVNKIINR